MRIVLANPNSTAAITAACATLARVVASPGTEIVPWTNRARPLVVDSLYRDAMAGAALVKGLVALDSRPEAIVLAGFGNYGTGTVQEAVGVPILNMAEAAMAFATPLCHRFAIITTSARIVPYTEDVVQRFVGSFGTAASLTLSPARAGRARASLSFSALDVVVADGAARLRRARERRRRRSADVRGSGGGRFWRYGVST